jgi:hypothetical protein
VIGDMIKVAVLLAVGFALAVTAIVYAVQGLTSPGSLPSESPWPSVCPTATDPVTGSVDPCYSTEPTPP